VSRQKKRGRKKKSGNKRVCVLFGGEKKEGEVKNFNKKKKVEGPFPWERLGRESGGI